MMPSYRAQTDGARQYWLRGILTETGSGNIADHLGNYRLIVMYANRKKSGKIPDASTDFFGCQRSGQERLYQTWLTNLNRKTSLACRDAQLRSVREGVTQCLGMPLVTSEVDNV